VVRQEEADQVKRRVMKLVHSAIPEGGKVQRRSGPDAWAVVLAAAWVIVGTAFGLALVDPSPSPGIASVMAIGAVTLAVIAVSLHRRNV
jgi:hypothetical protein